jgi:hypothetical protein
MRGRTVSRVVALFGSGVLLSAGVAAQERSAPAGAVVVRPVQVREVRVTQPAPPPLHDQRPTFGVPRPVDPAFISRPIQRPQVIVSNPRPLVRRHGRGRADFTPRFNIAAGVVVGYPVIYPYAYPYDPFSPSYGSPSYAVAPPSPNTYSNVDSLPSYGNVTAAAAVPAAILCEASAPCGGISFDIGPASAQVYVDGSFAGIVEDFDANSEPLLLAPGSHYVEIRLAGYRTVSFDVTITPGEITPYQGTLERLRLRTP